MKNGGSHRLQWPDLPAEVSNRIAVALGSPVMEASGQSGGYGPGLVARCLLANGRRVFIKAVSPLQNPESVLMMRREAEVAQSLPDEAPAPALLRVLDDGFWVVLVFEDIEGALPAMPWNAEQLARVVKAMKQIARLPTWPALPTVAERYGEMLCGWRTLAAESPAAVSEPWCRDHLEELAALEAKWEDAAAGDDLVHGDVRSDNVLLTGDGRVVFVDWSTSCIGAPWFDLIAMLPSIELEGGGAPESVLRLAESALDPRVLVPVVAAIAGYFVERGRLPDPPGLPTVRDFQRAQAGVTVAWLRRLLPAAV